MITTLGMDDCYVVCCYCTCYISNIKHIRCGFTRLTLPLFVNKHYHYNKVSRVALC